MTPSVFRVPQRCFAAALLLLLSACGGGGIGGGNDGTVVERVNIVVTGLVDDGTPTSPLPGATCSVLDLDGVAINTGTADADGDIRLIVPPGLRTFNGCAPAGLPAVEMRVFLSTVGIPDGGDIGGQDVIPAYSVVRGILELELRDDPDLDAEARAEELIAAIETDPAVGLLAEVSTLLFNLLLDEGLNLPFEPAFLDLVVDGTLDADGYEAIQDALNAGVAEAEATFGLSVEEAYLAVYPPLDLVLLHHSGAASALRFVDPDQPDFGGVARFRTLLDAQRAEAGERALVVSAGDHVAAGVDFAGSLNVDLPYPDSIAAAAIAYDVMSIGERDFGLGPGIFAAFAGETGATFISSNIDASTELFLRDLIQTGRLLPLNIIEVAGRRIGIVSALEADFRDKSSSRAAFARIPVEDVVQIGIDALLSDNVSIIVLVSQMADLQEDIDTLALLSDVDVMIAAGDDAIFANGGELLIPGDEGSVVATYPSFEPDLDGNMIPVIATGGRFGYLGRAVLRFDAAGDLLDVVEGGPIRVAGGDEPDAVEEDAELLETVIAPVQAEIDALAEFVFATTQPNLDATTASLQARETNFGNVAADAVLALAQNTARNFNAPFPDAAVIDSTSIGNDSIIEANTQLTGAVTFDLGDPERIIAVVDSVPPDRLKQLFEHALALGASERFLQVSENVILEWDPTGTAQELDADGAVVVEGTRVVNVTVSDVAIILNGEVTTDAPSIDIATTSFLGNGGLDFPTSELTTVGVGETVASSITFFVQRFLNGTVGSEQYPEGGSDRIVELSP